MFYNFMELPDKTIISHSELIKKDGKEQVKVYIEKPIYGGFATATCYLPEYKWTEVSGFTEKEMEHLKDIVESEAHMIFEFAANGGFENAANNNSRIPNHALNLLLRVIEGRSFEIISKWQDLFGEIKFYC